MAFGFDDPAYGDIRRRAEAQRQPPPLQSPPQLRPLVGPGGMFWESFEAPTLSGGRPAPERQPAPWEYGPEPPQIAPPPMAGPTMFSEPDMGGVLSGASSGADELPRVPGVQSGASSTAGPSVGLPPPPQPSGLRVKLQGGDWQEADPEGHLPMPPQQRSATAYDPVDRREEPVSAPSGGGTFSMMTAPENVDLATRGSQLEDAQFESQIRQLRDPNAERKDETRFRTDEAIRLAEANDRISMGKQDRMSQEAQSIQQESDQGEFALAQKYGIDPRDTEGSTIQDEMKRQQYQQERESLKRQVQAQMTILLSRYGMAPRSAAGYEALSGF